MEYLLHTPLGAMLMSEQGGAVTALRFLSEGEGEELTPAGSDTAQRLQRWLDRYFAGEKPAVDLPLAPEGTEFQRRVWRATSEIPYGETLSYSALARRIGCGSARAVGGALAKNPIWILIPCHRVRGADGSLTGYAGGLDRKAALLALERSF